MEREKEDAQSGSNGEGKLMDIRLINPGLYLKMDGWMHGWKHATNIFLAVFLTSSVIGSFSSHMA